MRPRRDERGSATPAAVALAGLLVLVGLASAFVVATAVAHRRVQAAADLAALAGASSLQRGEDPCDVATTIAVANGAAVVDCGVEARDVLVTARLAGPRLWGHGWQLEGRARAGPAAVPGAPEG